MALIHRLKDAITSPFGLLKEDLFFMWHPRNFQQIHMSILGPISHCGNGSVFVRISFSIQMSYLSFTMNCIVSWGASLLN